MEIELNNELKQYLASLTEYHINDITGLYKNKLGYSIEIHHNMILITTNFISDNIEQYIRSQKLWKLKHLQLK